MIAGFGSWSATIGPASSTAPGYVTTSAQTFAGVKTFTDGIAIGSTATPTLTLNATTTTIGTITFAGAASNDTGTNPIGVLNARIGASTSVATRPLLAVQNNGTTVAQITATPTFWVAANPSVTAGRSIGTQTTFTHTSSSRCGIESQSISGPSGASSGSTYGVIGQAGTGSGNGQNHTSSAGLVGVAGDIIHRGTATVTAAACLYANGIASTGGGTITTGYGLLVPTLSGASTVWGISVATNASYFGGAVTFNAQANLKSYTVATLPSAATAGGLIYVSNEAGGATPAFSDATNWRRCTDLTIVS